MRTTNSFLLAGPLFKVRLRTCLLLGDLNEVRILPLLAGCCTPNPHHRSRSTEALRALSLERESNLSKLCPYVARRPNLNRL